MWRIYAATLVAEGRSTSMGTCSPALPSSCAQRTNWRMLLSYVRAVF